MTNSGINLHVSRPKSIVICSDGTGNHDIKARGTNVFKLYEAVDIHGVVPDAECPRQVAIYDNGVGTSGPAPLRAICGAFGIGFSANVRHLYRSLLEVYSEGDQLYLFGFSRGAYTVRALTGLIQASLRTDAKALKEPPAVDLDDLARESWRRFKKLAFDAKGKSERNEEPPRLVRFLGVWDTVGAVGFPLVDLTRPRNRWVRWAFWFVPWFGDNLPCDTVERACQALALDDQRATFRPELWNEGDARDPSRIEQVWFAGVHANVGGGYPRQGMSLVALDWMMRQAENAGLRFIHADRASIHARRDVHDKLYDSRAGLGVYYRWKPRRVVALSQEQKITKPPKIHESAFQRIARATEGYSPMNVPLPCEVVYTNPPGPHSDPPTYSKHFSPDWNPRDPRLLVHARSTFLGRARAFFADYCLLQLGLGTIVGVFVHQFMPEGSAFLAKFLAIIGVFVREAAQKDDAFFATLFAVSAALVTVVGVSIGRLFWFGLDAALRLIDRYKKYREADDQAEAQSGYHCLTEIVGFTISAGQRSYRLTLTITLLAAAAGVASLFKWARLDGYHALWVLVILVIMAWVAWSVGSSVDKRLAAVTRAFWSKERRDAIQAALLEEPTAASVRPAEPAAGVR